MRDEFPKQTQDFLAKRTGTRCSNPDCQKLTTGPRSDSTKIINIGVAAHITAAAPNGPRFDPNLSSEERKSPDNGIWLCQNCAKLVDNDPDHYSVKILQSWKHCAENAALSEIQGGGTSQKLTQEKQVDLEISYLKIHEEKKRHDYVLEIKVQNLGQDAIQSYHLDLEFPACVVEKSKASTFLVTERSDHKTCFFRSVRHEKDDFIYPGDTKEIMSFPYFIDLDIYIHRGQLLDKPVKAIFYREGFHPLTIEKPFRDLQSF